MFQNSVRLVKDVDGLGDRGVVSRLTTTSYARHSAPCWRDVSIPLPNMRRGLRTRPRQQSPESRLKSAQECSDPPASGLAPLQADLVRHQCSRASTWSRRSERDG